MAKQKRGYHGKRFTIHVFDNGHECRRELSTDEYQALLMAYELGRLDGRPDRGNEGLPNVQRCDGYTPDNGRCRFCVRVRG